MSDPLLLRAVTRTYRGDAGELPVLRGADLTVRAGEIVALVAPPAPENPPCCTSPDCSTALTAAPC
jgi:hypothetical protein